MDINEFFRSTPDGLQFTEHQSSHFAKSVAGDFNPLHDVGGKRFCVPGDLLFGILLSRYGAYSDTAVEFSGMLGGAAIVQLPDEFNGALLLSDQRDRDILKFTGRGKKTTDPTFINNLVGQYVRFSGRTFPDLLVPLMRDSTVMINPDRPLVIYRDMALRLNSDKVELLVGKIESTGQDQVELSLTNSELIADGKKGRVQLGFSIKYAGELIGEGEKNFVLGGLRDFDEQAMQGVVDTYNARKSGYKSEGS
ncbi:MAG: DUF3581 family protein [Granulosicoccus sp.]